MLRVLIADDHEVVRRGLRSVVESRFGWEVCGECGRGDEVLACLATQSPDIVILDVSLPDMDGVTLTRQIRDTAPSAQVLLFSMCDDDETVTEGLLAGARGYVVKSEGESALSAALNALGAQKTYLSPMVTDIVMYAATNGHKTRLESLTPRELEVGRLFAEGLSNKLIARKLDISIKTVESHRGTAMRKAGVHSAAHFLRFAVKNNLIPVERQDGRTPSSER